ncbi:hypothetical protein M8C21_030592 [Ambrosia artemisiifolia]|uniref:CASP-like protein n=1 Tax=Ambrosia artemisiifolia TaxID=4212 RepID=A0AAD5CQI0_AMBAR|nr:hypothetical protein M8C21_030592 [Ambrosia artemisiifolia]
MASIETGVPTQVTSETQTRWSSKLTKYVSSTGSVAVKNHMKVDVALRFFLFVGAFVLVVATVTSKQTAEIYVAPGMKIRVDAKFTHLASFTESTQKRTLPYKFESAPPQADLRKWLRYLVTAFSVIGLYSIITGYLSYSALKKQERSHQLLFVLLDSLMLSIAASATGAAGGVGYEALKGNPHVRWVKMCHIFDTFCDHIASAESMALVTSITLLMLVWVSVSALVKNNGR